MLPQKIKIPSDSTELKLTDTNTDMRTKVTYGKYLYTRAEHFLGKELILSEAAIEKMIKNGTAIEVNENKK